MTTVATIKGGAVSSL
ncbi:hypothetical protein LINPERPRIM_LOCUS44616 [Linum perenne]